MLSGSGSNLKVATYLAAGLPLITTPIGARSYDLVDGEHALICGPGFSPRDRPVLDDRALAEELARRGRRLVEQRHDWKAVAAEFIPALVRLLDDRDLRDELLEPACAALLELGIGDDEALARRIATAVSEIASG
jgi:glycosyltransferase involved in cell wall biosynthesis